MTKEEMREGFAAGRTLIQEDWAKQDEITAVDELVAEGAAVVTDWRFGETPRGYATHRQVRKEAWTND